MLPKFLMRYLLSWLDQSCHYQDNCSDLSLGKFKNGWKLLVVVTDCALEPDKNQIGSILLEEKAYEIPNSIFCGKYHLLSYRVSDHSKEFNPSPAEHRYTLPLQTV